MTTTRHRVVVNGVRRRVSRNDQFLRVANTRGGPGVETEPAHPRRPALGWLCRPGADGASATALQPPPHLLTTLPARGRTVRLPRSRLAGARQTRARVRRAAAVPAAGAARRSDL